MLPVLLLVFTLFGGSLSFDDWDQFQLVWSDEFETLDLNKWQHEITAWGGGNSEFQLYTQDPVNSYVSNGMLNIVPTLLIENTNPQTDQPYGEDFMTDGILDVVSMYGSCTNHNNGGCYRTGADNNIPPIMSARLRTFQRFSYLFGRAVVRARMPVGDWKWPAIWMLPEGWDYGDWPLSGEVDYTEIIGNRNFRDSTGAPLGIQKSGSTLHWGASWDQNRYYLTHASKLNETHTYGDEFHNFIFDWDENGLSFYVDDEDNSLMEVPYPLLDEGNTWWVDFWEWGSPWNQGTANPWVDGTNLAPFDRAFHFILNVAVGGTNGFIPDDMINQDGAPEHQKPWRNSDAYKDAMQKYYDARENWRPTWDGEGVLGNMQIDYIRVYQKIV